MGRFPLAATIAAIALAGCNVTAPDSIKVASRVELAPDQIALMQEKVRASLKDPASAQFGSYVAGANAAGVVMVCGLVNAKNGFGGYTGMSPFTGAFDRGTFVVAGVVSSPDAVRARYQVCEAQGLPLAG